MPAPPSLVVDQIWRYPVKSIGGDRVAAVAVGPLGLEGDRRWGIVDRGTGAVLTGRREPPLLLARAASVATDRVVIETGDGDLLASDDELSAWLGRAVALVSSAGSAAVQFEVPDPDEEEWASFSAAEGAWHDSPRARVSLLSHGSAAPWDIRRFRANVLLHGDGEDDLVGATVRIGSATLAVTKPISRCVMLNRPIPGADADRSVLRTVLRERDGHVAIGALVVTPGTISEGDPVEVLDGA